MQTKHFMGTYLIGVIWGLNEPIDAMHCVERGRCYISDVYYLLSSTALLCLSMFD